MIRDRLDVDRLVAEGCQRAGSDDLGEATWQDPLTRVVDGLVEEAHLHELGVEVAADEIVGYLANRASMTEWRRHNPDVGTGTIEAPIVIVGQPRTGTTILHDLLAQDRDLRAPLTWEVDRPVPAPEPATFATDPRIDEVQATLEMADSLIPGFTDFHPMGATLAQECVRMTAADFRSLIFSTVYRLPTYNHWLLHEADLAPTYRWHRRYLQHLQSRTPAPRWLLKSPAHLWHFPALLAEYPDAIVVQTHRDPLKVVASVSALAAHLRQIASDETSVPEAAAQYGDDIFLGLDRASQARDDGTLPPDQVIDVHFADFMDAPLDVIGTIYDQVGLELSAETEDRMRRFLVANPGNVGGGRYRFADTGLDADALRERSQGYLERYGVRPEPIT